MSTLQLKRNGESFVIAVDLWDDLLTWAEEHGWNPRNDPEWYRRQRGGQVDSLDAANLADALEEIAGELVIQECDVPDAFLKELMEGLSQLTRFFNSGSFRID